MKWLKEDLEKYVNAKEYIDTVIIPVLAFQVSDDTTLGKDSFYREVLAIYANELEKELSGRIMLTPTYTYVKTADLTNEIHRLHAWIDEISTQPFKEIFILTLDPSWKKFEKELDGNLLWLPGMNPTDLKSSSTVKLIRNQVEQISDLIRSYW